MSRTSHSVACVALLTLTLHLPGSAWADEIFAETPRKPGLHLRNLVDRTADVAVQALSLLGVNYKYGGTSPETGMDCSGLVQHVFKEAWGARLPRTTSEISLAGQPVNHEELQPGDLVFFNTLRRTFSHVGIYLGDKKFIHSPSSGGQVRVESMDVSYWKSRFNGARRISDPVQLLSASQ